MFALTFLARFQGKDFLFSSTRLQMRGQGKGSGSKGGKGQEPGEGGRMRKDDGRPQGHSPTTHVVHFFLNFLF